jgi:glycosyltransferase involved in cell wall biosynthesis
MRKQRYTIIDAHNVPSMLWGQLAAYAAGISERVSTIQSFYNREYTGLKGRIYGSVLFFNHFLSTHYVAVAPGIQDQLVKQGYQSTLIPNIIAIPPMEEPPADVPQRQAWGFGPDDFVIGIVARLDPVKGHTLLLQALAQVHDVPRMKLLIIGDGPLRPKLEAETLRLGLAARVHFMGFQSNVQQLLPRIDCLCVASLSEGMPFAVLEAAAQAKPIVATAVGGLVSLLEHNRTAILVQPNDPAALAAGLRWMAEHPEQARSLGQAAYAHVCAIMNIDRFIAATLDVYSQVHR